MQDRKTIRQRGVAVVEFALILPLLLILTFVVIEAGRALYEYNTLTKAVRDAARYLSVQTPNTRFGEARNLIVYGNLAGSGNPLLPGLSATNVPDPVWANTGSDPVFTAVTVRVSGYTFQTLFPGGGLVGFANFTFSDITATMRSHL